MAQINKPTDYFNTVLYTGDGTSGRTISGVGFQSDFLWIKSRSNATNHSLTDVIRGGDLQLRTNTTDAESQFGSQDITFTSDGFTNAGTTSNNSGFTFVAWNWLAGGTASSNTDGSITSTVSVNTTSRFSIVSYTGTGSASTIGHGLGAVPKMYIVKNRSTGSTQWRVYHASLGATKHMALDSTQAVGTASSVFNNTEPTSSVFSVGTDDAANKSGDNLIAYCFAEKKGYSKFGSYTGNGNANGTFVYTGFKPAFYIIKRTDTTGAWIIKDNLRPGYNVNGSYLVANDSLAESTGSGNVASDELSNGFKIRGTSSSLNTSGGSYIYMAFAENPLVGTNNIPATAR